MSKLWPPQETNNPTQKWKRWLRYVGLLSVLIVTKNVSQWSKNWGTEVKNRLRIFFIPIYSLIAKNEMCNSAVQQSCVGMKRDFVSLSLRGRKKLQIYFLKNCWKENCYLTEMKWHWSAENCIHSTSAMIQFRHENETGTKDTINMCKNKLTL
jgi:hypothetical protein